MGTQYKISPQIEEYIIYFKKENPKVSCRKLEGVLKEKFQIKLSKSSINAIIKEAGLSEGVGRKPSKVKAKPAPAQQLPLALPTQPKIELIIAQPAAEPQPEPVQPEEPTPLPEAGPKKAEPEIAPSPVPAKEKQIVEAGACIYKCADLILDGLKYVLRFMDLSAVNQDFIKDAYLKINRAILNNTGIEDAALSEEFEKSASLICRHLPQKLEEAHFIKMTLQDNSLFYIDADFSSFWPTINIPSELSFSADWVKARLLDNINKNTVTLLTAPFDSSLLSSLLRLSHIGLKKAELLGDAGRLIYSFEGKAIEKLDFVFGISPEECGKFIRVINKTEGARLRLEALNKEFEIEDSKIEVTGLSYFQETELRALGLRKPGATKPFFYIITNIPAGVSDPQKLTRSYLEYWPDPEFAVADLEKKVELLNYDIKRQFPNYPAPPAASWDSILSFWREALQTYILKHFLPFDYEKYTFPRIKERFYDLNAEVEENDEYCVARFILPQDYAFRNDLEYILGRLNQKNIKDIDGKRLWFVAD